MRDWIMRACVILLASLGFVGVACSRDPIPADGVTTTSNDATTLGDGSGESGESGDPSDTDTSGGDTDASTSIFVPVDVNWPSPSCDPFAQDCPEGEKCVPYGSTGGNWDANKCVPITGDKQPGETCSYGGVVEATDDCDASSHCWEVMNVDGELMGVCTLFCTGTPEDPQCPEKTSCLIANDGSIALCIKTCDPVAQDCGPGLVCIWAVNNFNCVFEGMPDPGVGEPCSQSGSCAAGNMCVSGSLVPDCDTASCCAQLCSIADPECMQPQTECVQLHDEPPYEDIGVCIVE